MLTLSNIQLQNPCEGRFGILYVSSAISDLDEYTSLLLIRATENSNMQMTITPRLRKTFVTKYLPSPTAFVAPPEALFAPRLVIVSKGGLVKLAMEAALDSTVERPNRLAIRVVSLRIFARRLEIQVADVPTLGDTTGVALWIKAMGELVETARLESGDAITTAFFRMFWKGSGHGSAMILPDLLGWKGSGHEPSMAIDELSASG
jgi:hypothetical protein